MFEEVWCCVVWLFFVQSEDACRLRLCLPRAVRVPVLGYTAHSIIAPLLPSNLTYVCTCCLHTVQEGTWHYCMYMYIVPTVLHQQRPCHFARGDGLHSSRSIARCICISGPHFGTPFHVDTVLKQRAAASSSTTWLISARISHQPAAL
jgi:hypothetical protein